VHQFGENAPGIRRVRRLVEHSSTGGHQRIRAQHDARGQPVRDGPRLEKCQLPRLCNRIGDRADGGFFVNVSRYDPK
jgi:hypothetical protein